MGVTHEHHTGYICTVEPRNKGHLGDIESVLYSEVSLIQR